MRGTLKIWVVVLAVLAGTAQGYYSPTEGRWLSRDPIGEEDLQNLYAFVANDVVNQRDLLGMMHDFGVWWISRPKSSTISQAQVAAAARRIQDLFLAFDMRISFMSVHLDVDQTPRGMFRWISWDLVNARDRSNVDGALAFLQGATINNAYTMENVLHLFNRWNGNYAGWVPGGLRPRGDRAALFIDATGPEERNIAWAAFHELVKHGWLQLMDYPPGYPFNRRGLTANSLAQVGEEKVTCDVADLMRARGAAVPDERVFPRGR